MPYSTDSNQTQIVRELKSLGYSVQSLAKLGEGVSDLLVAKRDVTIAVELKTENGKFKVGQLRWMSNWNGLCGYAKTLDEVLELFEDKCLTASEKGRILAFVERWELDGKGKEISLKAIDKLLERF